MTTDPDDSTPDRTSHTIEWRDPDQEEPEPKSTVIALTNHGIQTCRYKWGTFQNDLSGTVPEIVYGWAPVEVCRDFFEEGDDE